MAKDIYFNNVPPHQDEAPRSKAARRPSRQAPAPGENAPEALRPQQAPRSRGTPAQRIPEQPRTQPAPARQRTRGKPAVDSAARPTAYSPAKNRKASAPPPEPVPRRKRQQPPANVPEAQPPKKRHILRKFFIFLLVLLLICGGALTLAYNSIVAGYTPIPMQKSGVADQKSLMHSANVYNILLMGVDQADTDTSTRSDSMILMSVDRLHQQIKLTTFMRDMYVEIPGHGQTKLNHACMYEGPQLTVDTIEMNFGVRIDAYAKIGYDLFIELVNGVGGITVAEIDDTESRALAEEGVYKEPGTNVYFTGEEAIKYVRIRHWQSDFARTERQREVITLIIDRAKKTPPHKLLALARSIASKIECTVPKAQLPKLALEILPCLFNDISQQQIPADGTWSDDIKDSLMVLIVDFDRNREIIKQFIYGG